MNHKIFGDKPRDFEALCRLILENILDLVFITDDDGRFSFVCPSVTPSLGYTVEEIEAMGSISKLLGDSLFDGADLSTKREIKNIETEVVDKHGRKHVYLVTVKKISIHGGTILYVCHDATERKRSEEALIKEKEFAELAQEIAHIGSWKYDLKTEELCWSDEFYRIYGLEPDETKVGLNHGMGMIHPDDKYMVEKVFDRAIKDGLPYEIEYRIIRPNGEERFLRGIGKIEKDQKGGFLNIYGTGQDITDHKKTEEALRVSESKLREAQKMAHLGHWYWDVKTGAVEWSEEVFKIFQLDPQEFTPQIDSILELSPWPEDHQRDKEIMQKVIEGHTQGSYEQRFLFPDGSIGYYYSTFQGVFDHDGGLIAMKGTVQDITERKRTEERLRESERRFRTIIDTALEGIWVIDKNRLTTYVNQRVLTLLGYSFDEMLGKKITDFLDDENTEKYEIKAKRQKDGISNQYDLRLRRKDGSEMWGIVSTTPLFDSEGKVAGGFSMITDITERKLAQYEKKRLEARLQRAEKMEAIGTLAGGVAHDLNNVLSGLVSYPDLILMDLPGDSPLRDAVLTIKDSGKKAAAIVQDLLTLARRGVAVSEVVNLNDVVSDYLVSAEHEKLKTFYQDARFKTDLQVDLLNVLGSPVHLSKTIMNLVSNAVESLRDGGVVTISTRNEYIDRPIKGYDEVKEGDFVALTVEDNGIGIANEDLEKIFEPFYTKKVMGRSGTGLGMAVVWGTVKDHNGYINVESTEGRGSKFTLYFPITRKAEEKGGLLPNEDYAGNGEKILIVDDIAQQREIASALLKKLGYSVDSVSSGEDAVNYMKENLADLVILDMIMDPGMDGLDTYRKLLELHPGQKAIIASGFSETSRVKEAQRLGAGQYVKKPYTLEKIGLAVKTELSR